MTRHHPITRPHNHGIPRRIRPAAGVALLVTLVVAVIVFLTGHVALAADPAPAAPLIEWNPSESYPWGSQYDARLDRPFHIWRTAIPLTEVFTEIERQTGVRVGLWSLDDSSRELGRLRLNVYLNPKDPPSLRSFLAQLSWVLDYALAYRPAESGAATRYDVLCSDPGPVGLATLSRMMDVSWAMQKDILESYRRKSATRLEEYHDALALSRDELAARYRGSDDALLYDFTTESHRAVISFLFALPPERIQEFLREGRILVKWDTLSQGQRSLLSQAFPAPACPVGGVDIGSGGDGSIWVRLKRAPGTPAAPGSEDAGWGPLADRTTFALGRSWNSLSPDEAVARALGEVTTPAEEKAYREKRAQDAAKAAVDRDMKRRDEATACQRALEALSPQMETRLSAIVLPTGAEPGRLKLDESGRALWALSEVQQAVAAATGVNIVSDCFWQPRRPLLQPGVSEYEAYRNTPPAQQLTALLALRGATFGGVDAGGNDIRRFPLSQFPTRLAWEWGDAGTFLRFRSTERELWRASLLPADAVAQLDQVFEQSAVPPAAQGGAAAPFDLRQLAALAGNLSDLEASFGAHLAYGDPSEEEEAARRDFREQALTFLNKPQFLALARFLSSLTEKQWRQSESNGLVVAKDLSPDQQSALRSLLSGEWAPEWARKLEAPVRHAEVERLPECVLKAAGAAPGRPGIFGVCLVLGDETVYENQYHQPVPHPVRPAPGRGPAAPPAATRAPRQTEAVGVSTSSSPPNSSPTTPPGTHP